MSFWPTWKSAALGVTGALQVARAREPDTSVTVVSLESSNTSTMVRRPFVALVPTTRCRPRVRIGSGADVVSKTVISAASPPASLGGNVDGKYAMPPNMLDAKYKESAQNGWYRSAYRQFAFVRTDSSGPLLSGTTRWSVTHVPGTGTEPSAAGRTTRPDTDRGALWPGLADAALVESWATTELAVSVLAATPNAKRKRRPIRAAALSFVTWPRPGRLTG